VVHYNERDTIKKLSNRNKIIERFILWKGSLWRWWWLSGNVTAGWFRLFISREERSERQTQSPVVKEWGASIGISSSQCWNSVPLFVSGPFVVLPAAKMTEKERTLTFSCLFYFLEVLSYFPCGSRNIFYWKSNVWLTVHRNSVWIRKTN